MSVVQSRAVLPTPVHARVLAALVAFVLSLLALQGAGAPTAAAADAVPVTYAGPAYPVAGGPPSADKPQSKLWHNDGAWWGLLRSTGGPITIHRLQDHVWQDTGTVVDDRAASTGDALWEGGKLYVSSRVAGSTGTLRVVRMSYDSTTDGYSLDAGFPITIGKGGSESITIARDSLSRLWVTYTQGSRVYVAHTTGDDTTWTAPFVIPVPDTTLSSDDISAVIAFGGKVGVMYSDQQSQVMRFAVHVDTAPDDSWTMESAYSGGLAADDHINLKSLLEDDQGRIYAAVKTSNDGSAEPSIVVLQRTSAGDWTNAVAATKAENATRPQLALDSTNRQLYVLMTSPESNGGGIVYYKRAPLGALSFASGKGTAFISTPNVKVNNPSTTKQAVTAATGLVVLATDDTNGRYYHGELYLGAAPTLTPAPDSTAPSAPTGVTGTSPSSTSVALSWTASTDNVGVTGYRVFRNGTQVGTPTDTSSTDSGLTAATTYSYTVAAVDAAGNVSAQSSPATSVTTQTGTTTPPPSDGSATFVAAATATGTTTSTAVASPAGVQARDVLVAAVATRGAPTITAPAGWTQVRLDANGSTIRQAVFVKVATSSDGSATFTLSRANSTVAQVLAYRGIDTTNPVVSAAGAPSTTATITSPATASVAGGPVLTFAGIARTTPLTPGTGLVERSEITTASSATYKVTADASDTTATGTTAGPHTTTANGSSGGVGQTVTLRAADGDTGTPEEPTDTTDTTAPSVPSGVTGTSPSATSVDVAWTASTDAVGVTGYRVFRDDVQVGTPTGTTYADTGLTASTTYSYEVAAVDAAGNVSAKSSPVSVTTPAGSTQPPASGGSATFVGAATATGTTTSTAVTSPAGVQAGDVLVAAVATRGAPTITAPTGWTLVRLDANGSTMRQAVFVKAATGTDGSATFMLSKAQSTVVQVLAYRGVSTTSPVVASAGAASTTATVTSPAAAGVAGGPVIAFAGIARTTPLTPGAGLVERTEVTTASTATYKVTADASDTTAPGTTAGPYTTTANGSSGGVGQTVTLRPSA